MISHKKNFFNRIIIIILVLVMKLINKNEIIIKKSRFLGFIYEIDNEEDIKNILNNIRKEHKKAKHFPYAYKLNNMAKKSDDKEPSGTAGLPIYNIIERNNLNNILIIIVRYFGGIELGAGGLIRAYSHTASNLLDNKK